MVALSLNKYWWAITLRGIFAVIFAIAAFAWPGLTFEVMIVFFGAYLFIEGFFAVISAIKAAKHHKSYVLLIIDGFLSLFFGTLIFAWPLFAAKIFVVLFAIWAIVSGFLEIVTGFSSPLIKQAKLIFGISGIFSLILGILILTFPIGGMVAFIWLIAAYILLFGILQIWLGLKLKKGEVSISVS